MDRKIKNVEPYSIDWQRAAFHYDDSLVKDLVYEILANALIDWRYIGDMNTVYIAKGSYLLKRSEICEFFNSDFFETILEVFFPQCTQSDVCDYISDNRDYTFKHIWRTGYQYGKPRGRKREKNKEKIKIS